MNIIYIIIWFLHYCINTRYITLISFLDIINYYLIIVIILYKVINGVPSDTLCAMMLLVIYSFSLSINPHFIAISAIFYTFFVN